MIRRRPTLKELHETKYLFPESDLLGMLDDLLKKGSFNFQSQRGLKRLEELLILNIAVII